MPEDASQLNGSLSLEARILLLETDNGRGEVMRSLLRSLNCRVRSCSIQEEVPGIFASRSWDVIFCDLSFSEVILPLVQASQPPIPVILFANYDEISQAQTYVSEGKAFGWLPVPLRTEKVLKLLTDALAVSARPAAVGAGPNQPGTPSPRERHFGLMTGESAPMQELYRQIEKVASSEMTVLILGESGTGKELVAKAIHSAGSRKGSPFIPVNCSSLPENLLESELFGYVKGAFTGAVHNKDGLFVAANGGTLFLDEIGSIPPATQMALLRVLQEREVRPVGATHSIPVNVRVLAATNEDVEKLRDEGKFRQDLFYRISAFTLRIPALRDRDGDLALLEEECLQRLAPAGRPPLRLAVDAREALRRHSWPGNIRELLHVLERGATLAENGTIRKKDLPAEFQKAGENSAAGLSSSIQEKDGDVMTLKAYLRFCERQYLRKVLEGTNGDKEKAARLLGISVATMYRKLSES